MAVLNIMVAAFLVLLLMAALAAMCLDLLGIRERPRAEALEDWSEEASEEAPEEAPRLSPQVASLLAAPVAEVIFRREGQVVHRRPLFASKEMSIGAAEDPVLEGDVAFRSLTVKWEQGQPWFQALDSTGLPRYVVHGEARQVTARTWLPWLAEGELELGGCAISWEPRAPRSGAVPARAAQPEELHRPEDEGNAGGQTLLPRESAVERDR